MYIVGMKNNVNLNAVFWDLPKFKDPEYLQTFLKEQKDNVPYYWAMTRFLRYGRIVDTFKFFDIHEISENLDKLQLPESTLIRWKRMIEVYG